MKIKHKIFNRQWIKAQSQNFRDTFVRHYINSGLIADLDEMANSRQEVYIFSGVIRDFFLDIDDIPRDVDIVLFGKSIDNILLDGLKVINQFDETNVQENIKLGN